MAVAHVHIHGVYMKRGSIKHGVYPVRGVSLGADRRIVPSIRSSRRGLNVINGQ